MLIKGELKMDYKLIALDLDETTLCTDKSITQHNKAAIRNALNSGIKVVLCSGRTLEGMMGVANELGILGPKQYIITNGGDIIENMDKKIIFKRILSSKECFETTNFLNKKMINFVLIDTNGTTYATYKEWMENGSQSEIVKILMHVDISKMESTEKLLHYTFDKNYFVVKTGNEYLEIFPKDINKGQSVKRLADYLKIDLQQVMAIGDMDNDISMIKLAGMGVAMENAQPMVKDIADYITKDNNHSSVGLAIEKFAL